MATESSAIVRMVRLAESGAPIRPAGERTMVVRVLESPRRDGRVIVLAAIVVAAAVAAGVFEAQPPERPAAGARPQPIVTPLAPPPPAPTVSPLIEPAASLGFGTLQIGSKPPCDIFIDGRDLGLQTPQRGIRLDPGAHLIGLRNDELGIEADFTVRVQAGETTKVIRDFSDHL